MVEIRGLEAGDGCLISLNDSVRTVFGNETMVFNVARSDVDLIAVQRRRIGAVSNVPIKVFRIPSLQLPASSATVIDFSLPYPGMIASPVLIDGSSSAGIGSYLQTPTRTLVINPSAPGVFFALPASVLLPTDRHSVRSNTEIYIPSGPGPLSLTSTPVHPLVPPQLLAYPYIRPVLKTSMAPPRHAYGQHSFNFSMLSSFPPPLVVGPKVMWTVILSDGWLGAGPESRYETTSFYGLPGWALELSFPPRTGILWASSRVSVNMREFEPGRISSGTSASGTIGEFCGDGVIQPAYETCEPPNSATCNSSCRLLN